MRMSKLFARTLREAPAEAEVTSHRLLIRAAFIRKLMAGVYSLPPLGLRTMKRIEAIVREEMDASGAQEIRLPIILPAEPWKATGRWDTYGELMFKLKDRHQRELGLGPTHEEAVTPLVAGDFASYRDLPVNLYQIEWKYRDEFRPRYGLLRVREFLMKDAYSFDRDEEGMRRSYGVIVDAYRRIFDRCGLDYRVVEADPGQIGGDVNHEFMAVAPVGEDEFVYCENGDYNADIEAARSRPPEPAPEGPMEPLAVVATPGRSTIQAVSELLQTQPAQMLKCMLYEAGGQTVAVLVPGDREVNESKVGRVMWPAPVRMFDDDDFSTRSFVKGFVGPQGLPDDVIVVADLSVRAGRDWVTGANEVDKHVTGANLDRDFRVDRWEDVSQVRPGDPCPLCGGRLEVSHGIVVGHTYQLGTRYSQPLDAAFVDEDGTARHYQMGCYGIGIGRIMASAAEQCSDDAGLTWPKAIAPFDAVVIATNMDQPRVVQAAERVYLELEGRGLQVVFDDRGDTAGVKFADADLIGYPIQIVVGKRGLESDSIDLKIRATGERMQQPSTDVSRFVAEELLPGVP
jgi:prolyl-tRNA synthetase